MKKLYSQEQFTLQNGLNVTLIRLPGYHTYSCYVAAPVGSLASYFSIDGKETPLGIAHFLEHRLFETKDGDAFSLFSSLGCDSNAYTTYEYTTYYFDTSMNLLEGIKVLLEMTNSVSFNEDSVNNEKSIIVEELKMSLDQPPVCLLHGLFNNLLIGSPLRYEIVGTEQSVNNTTLEDLKRVFETYYNLNNLRLFIIGDVDSKFINELENIELNNKLPNHQIEQIISDETNEIANKLTITHMDVPIPLIMSGVKKVNLKEKLNLDNATYEALKEIVSAILFSDSGVLVKEMQKEKLLTSQLTGSIQNVGDLTFIYVTTNSMFENKIIDKFNHFFANLELYIDRDMLNRVKRYILGNDLGSIDEISSLAYQVVSSTMRGFDYQDKVNALSIIDHELVLRYINQWKDAPMSTHIVKKEDK